MRAWLAIFGLLVLGAQAQAEDNPACAKFEDPLAYNACLAKLGPQAHGARAAPEPVGEAGGAHRVHGGGVITRGKNGRVHMEFSISH